MGRHGVPLEVIFGHTRIKSAADYQTCCPDGTDDCTQDAIGEDGKVGERSNNNGALDDRHGSQMPKGTHAESILPISHC